MSVSARNVVKQFGAFTALDNVSLDAADGEFLALLGPSGSGKTTLLRVLAGLEFPDSGSIAIAGEDMAGTGARDRRVGFVFQHYALFRHMTVADNIGFGLSVRPRASRPAAAAIAARVTELLDLVQLSHLGDRYPSQLSGGQRQRVALARALAVEPRILLLDEPFGALDAKVRKDLRRWLRDVHDRMGLTSVFVTHDQEEALDLADRVVVMNRGAIEQIDTPENVWNRPATAFVCDFLGGANRIDCTAREGGIDIGGVVLPNTAPPIADGPATGFIRPHEFRIGSADGPGLAVTLRRLQRTGAAAALETALPDGSIVEASIGDLPPGLLPGAALVLVPTTVRAYPADQSGSRSG
ncbi:sulfate/molybdate ABC transporter ATP-binding protein [Polymorphobacter fuscus]|uniref:Sulfate ABC transporter ATP-binding protein n=1 Tax=Sandarakinorhabdus fusca TaxID=1439888 RepID=A0A7C9GRI4_9SPHN|nr:sulfate/molybdate ABC transporter ATP-binding protein [Polymorphobacter fuscus]KAB7647880.1 sulfate/molybdate ABC transporter ATP-binding protein [Polymorphobacter fuscus]MQT17191.1 sulfate ABC transporter ATP-binding protein [Polymorphobacter fuscus]NJC08815.1 sulfate transport system ATP-binding protein [Polymorphobacter fuscus]